MPNEAFSRVKIKIILRGQGGAVIRAGIRKVVEQSRSSW